MTTAPKQLDVWWCGERIGALSLGEGRPSFAYAADWWQAPQARPLSQSLPLRAEPFDERATRPFFAGLLPEGEHRRLIAQALQVSRQNDFGLLDGIGGECAGAVSLLEPGQTPSDAAGQVRWLDEAALAKVLADLPQRPMLAGQAGIRLSLAGAQDKLPVVVDGEQIGLPLFGAPSTHILKPAIAGIEGSVANEAFCMRLAAAFKLGVAPVQVRLSASQPYLLVQRYDRVGLPVQRLHQEDFCQALGFVPEHKYQNEGGPDLAQAFALLRRATWPNAPQVLRLLDAVVFNALLGNHDAHGKNFSLLYGGEADLRLAPLYDLLSTAAYPHLTDKMAMKIGGKYRFNELGARHWDQFSSEVGLSPAQVRKRVLDIARRLPALAQQTRAQVEPGSDHPILDQIVALITERCALSVQRLLIRPPPSPFA